MRSKSHYYFFDWSGEAAGDGIAEFAQRTERWREERAMDGGARIVTHSGAATNTI